MNRHSNRNELIEEYIRCMEEEFLQEYSPSLVEETKRRETDKLWREIFADSYQRCSKETLHEITKKLLLRL